jgi:hypothetical protein
VFWKPRQRADPDAGRPRSARVGLFTALCVVCLLVASVYVARARLRAGFDAPSATTVKLGDATALGALGHQPQLVFLSTAVGDSYGKVSVASLDAPDGPRSATSLQCDRVYFAAGEGLCLGFNNVGGFLSSYSAYSFDDAYQPRHTFSQAGVPSRVRISPDGRHGAMTLFITGDSYAGGGFSTRTTIVDMATGATLGDLEEFAVWRDGVRFQAPDFNFWGVTFARDGNRFYATLGSGGKTYLVEADLSARTAHVLREGVECPSLSPDGTRLAFKMQVGGGGRISWRLHVLDLATLIDMPLAETRNIDDQVEWLDDDHILYAYADDGPPRSTATNIWMLPVDGSLPPQIVVPQAYSPAVAR